MYIFAFKEMRDVFVFLYELHEILCILFYFTCMYLLLLIQLPSAPSILVGRGFLLTRLFFPTIYMYVGLSLAT